MKLFICIALAGACLPALLFAETVKTRGVDYACRELVDLGKVKKAQRLGKSDEVMYLMKNGCFATMPRWKLKKTGEWGLAVKVEGTPKDFGFHNAPGMEKVDKIEVWMHRDNVW